MKSAILAAAVLLAGGMAATAGPLITTTFSLNTSGIEGMGTFYLAFQLADGSGTGDANNTVTLYDFNFGTGSAAGSPMLYGGASGDIASVLSLTDSDPFFNAAVEGFTPGALLTFNATFTDNPDVGSPVQDQFFMSVLDGGGNGIPTTDAVNDSFITVTLDGTVDNANGVPTPPRQTFAADLTQTSYNLPAPEAVPEPGSYFMLALGAGLLGLKGRLYRF